MAMTSSKLLIVVAGNFYFIFSHYQLTHLITCYSYDRKCCEASLPRYLSEYNVSFEGQECAYGLIIAVRLGYWNLTIKDVKHLNEVPAVLEWEIPFDTFYSNISFFRDPDIVSCYDTYLKHSLNNSSQSSGRRCHCRYGAPPANPYIRGSCLGVAP